ncbi:MAG TPA: RIO1 family regulatory kinase/ATPase, partial [Cellvibrionaceae bacterium]|nr:RIO1 family regulatory kinase/ATPase [Cellvibrionaceae bacterium]
FLMITSAEKHIYIQSPFFIPDDSILEALKAAALGGIDVRIMCAPRGSVYAVPYRAANTYFAELAAAGVRVPTPYSYVDGVLLMELIQDESGDPAPRLDDVAFPEDIAADYHRHMMGEIAKMLCAGLVHGDLSEFNVLVDAYGPVIIDLPQAVDAARNNNAKAMFMRDINNMTQYFGRYNPSLLSTRFGEEIWQLYQHGELTPASELTGVFTEVLTEVDLDAVLSVIEHAKAEEAERQARLLADQNDD